LLAHLHKDEMSQKKDTDAVGEALTARCNSPNASAPQPPRHQALPDLARA